MFVHSILTRASDRFGSLPARYNLVMSIKFKFLADRLDAIPFILVATKDNDQVYNGRQTQSPTGLGGCLGIGGRVKGFMR